MYNANYLSNEKNIVNACIEKWDNIAFSTIPINRRKAKEVILAAYKIAGCRFTPDIHFLTSVSAEQCSFLESMLPSAREYFVLKRHLMDELSIDLDNKQIVKDRFSGLFSLGNPYISVRSEKFTRLCDLLYDQNIYNSVFYKVLNDELSLTNLWVHDLYISNISNNCNLDIWNALKSLCEECQFLLTFDQICVVIERPIEIHLDTEQRPHANGKPAIIFADGYEIYYNHGVEIPEKYGKVKPHNWRPEWIFAEENNLDIKCIQESEELILALLSEIGYKRFSQELPKIRDRYWQKDGLFRDPSLIDHAIDNVIVEWQRFHYHEYYSGGSDINWQAENWNKFLSVREIIQVFPCKISDELSTFYLIYRGDYQLSPGLHFYPLEEAIKNTISGLDNHTIQLFHGDRQEIYYVLCDNEERMISPVYCQFPDEEPVIYAECVTSLIVTIAQCYQEGAYYIAIDEETGERSIQQDLDKIEPIFEKFNPAQIDNWRKIWKS
jgi:hypothetical protein